VVLLGVGGSRSGYTSGSGAGGHRQVVVGKGEREREIEEQWECLLVVLFGLFDFVHDVFDVADLLFHGLFVDAVAAAERKEKR
jgi:hypothetical protein